MKLPNTLESSDSEEADPDPFIIDAAPLVQSKSPSRIRKGIYINKDTIFDINFIKFSCEEEENLQHTTMSLQWKDYSSIFSIEGEFLYILEVCN
jgi:hypothetical protein